MVSRQVGKEGRPADRAAGAVCRRGEKPFMVRERGYGRLCAQPIGFALPDQFRRERQCLFVHLDSSLLFGLAPKPAESVWASLFVLRPSSFATAAVASWAWSASRV